MHTSILVKNSEKPKGVVFSLKGAQFSDDISDLAAELEESLCSLREYPNMLQEHYGIFIDVTKCKQTMFKPNRLVSLCEYYHDNVKNICSNYFVNLTLTESQNTLFSDLRNEVGFPVSIVEENDNAQESIIEYSEFFDVKEKNLHEQVLAIMHRWLQRHPNPDDKCYFIEKKYISPNDLFKEMQYQTKVGIRYRDSLVRLGFKFGLQKLI
jgi:hypothetical protein